MKTRPTTKQEFIAMAAAEKVDNETVAEDLHKYVRKHGWPLDDSPINPSMANGSNLRKNINLSLTECEWNSIDRHTKALGVGKSDWIRHAVFKQLQEEQIFFLKNKKES